MSGASWTPTRTSDSYTPAVQLEAGKPPKPCSVKCIRCVSVQEARECVAAGGVAWVRRDEWERVSLAFSVVSACEVARDGGE